MRLDDQMRENIDLHTLHTSADTQYSSIFRAPFVMGLFERVMKKISTQQLPNKVNKEGFARSDSFLIIDGRGGSRKKVGPLQ